MALAYTNVASLMYGILPMLGSVTTITSAQLVTLAEGAEAKINSRIGRLYALPITATVPALITIATDLALYRALALRVMTQDVLKDSVWPARYKDAEDWLDRIAKGEDLLFDSAGAILQGQTALAPITSTTDAYLPAVSDGLDNPIQWEIDNNKQRDDADDRLSSTGARLV